MTEELKKALEAAVTDEQKKAIVEKFKDEIQKLSDDELEAICGGFTGFSTMVSSLIYQNKK